MAKLITFKGYTKLHFWDFTSSAGAHLSFSCQRVLITCFTIGMTLNFGNFHQRCLHSRFVGGGGVSGSSTFPYFNMNMVMEKIVFSIGRIGMSDST